MFVSLSTLFKSIRMNKLEYCLIISQRVSLLFLQTLFYVLILYWYKNEKSPLIAQILFPSIHIDCTSLSNTYCLIGVPSQLKTRMTLLVKVSLPFSKKELFEYNKYIYSEL